MLVALVPAIANAQTQPATAATADAIDPPGTSAAALGLTDLTDDLSRQDLFAEIREADVAADSSGTTASAQYFNLYGPFRFPNDVDFDTALNEPRKDSLFGVDISHYTNSAFPIEQLRTRKIRFLYMKATQGTGSLDSKFAGFWSRAGKLPKGSEVHRGAYHFLSSGDPRVPAEDWGRAQAATFIKVIKANGGLLPTDMPPVVDLEWDKASKDGPDRWQGRKPAEIIAMTKAYLTAVETGLHRTPMIYTARSWWRERIGSETEFAALSTYPLWLADYSKTSRASEVPTTINGVRWALWQYTEAATMAIGFNGAFDANIFKGKTDAFYTSLGVAEFQQ
jgi:lysozyme